MPTFPSPQGLVLGPTRHWLSGQAPSLPPGTSAAQGLGGEGAGGGAWPWEAVGHGKGRRFLGTIPRTKDRAWGASLQPLVVHTPRPPDPADVPRNPRLPESHKPQAGVPGTGEQVSAIQVTVDMGQAGLSGQLWGAALALCG